MNPYSILLSTFKEFYSDKIDLRITGMMYKDYYSFCMSHKAKIKRLKRKVKK